MTDLSLVRLVALDTAQLGNWISDYASSDASRRSLAAQFSRTLLDRGVLVLICQHHLVELLQISAVDVARSRLQFMQTLPIVAWLGSADGSGGVGSIADLFACEVRAALEATDQTPLAVRDKAKTSLFKIGSGADAVRPYLADFEQVRQFVHHNERRSREIASVARFAALDPKKTKVFDLMRGRVRSPDGVDKARSKLQLSFQKEIATRGDQRIPEPSLVAKGFFDRAIDLAKPLPGTANDLVLKGMTAMGIDISEIGPETTIAQLGEMAIFRERLSEVARLIHRPMNDLKKVVRANLIPSWIIERSLRDYGQDLAERKGSDLTDGYLASLSPYADITFVDKRTKENLRRSLQQTPALRSIVRRMEAVTNYQGIERCLSSC